MKRYNKYKDSGIPWVGEIPEHWEKRRCKDFLKEKKEQVGDNKDNYTLLSLTTNGVIIRDLSEGKGKYPKDFATYKVVNPGNLIFCLFDVDETPRTIGCAYHQGMITGAYNVFSVEDIDVRFLYYYFVSLDDRKALKPLYKGLRKVIPLPSFMSMPLPIPPLPEQEAIVAYLEGKVSLIDELVKKQEKQIDLLRELKQSVIAKAVTQGIDKDVPLRSSGIPWMGEIPEHWEVKRLGLYFKENRSLNSNLVCTEAYKFNYGSLVRKDEKVDLHGLIDTYIKYTLLRENDIVVNGLNLNYDFISQRVAMVTQEGIITSAYLVLSPREDINSMYYCMLFKAMDSMKLFHGMGSGIRLTLSYKDLKNQYLPIPPLPEQEAIVADISRKTSEIDKLIAKQEVQITQLRELKQTLIADAVTGRINVQPS